MAGRTAWALITIAAVALGGCSWRLETEIAPTPTADAATAARDDAARAEAAIQDALAAAGSVTGPLAQYAAAAAPVHLETLGGVYIPYPDITPSPSPSPAPTLPLAAAVTAARDLALDLAFADSESEAAFLYGAIGLGYALALWLEDAPAPVDGGPAPIETRPLPGPHGTDTLVPEASDLTAQQIADLALAHDKARFLFEVIAARESDAARADALAKARVHAERAEALVQLAGVDPREPIYQIPDAEVASSEARRDAERAALQAMGWTYMTLTSGASADDRAWLMSAAFDAYAASSLVEGFAIAQIPVLPGASR